MKKALLFLCYLCLYVSGYSQKAPIVNLLKDIPANADYPPTDFIEFNDEVYFIAYSTGAGKELWKTDGTEEGTVMVKDIYAGGSNSDIAELTIFNDKLYFLASSSTTGREIWKTDGTEDGTEVLKDINLSNSTWGAQIGGLTVVGSILYFHANDGANGDELWKTDGTEAGTVLVKDINEGETGSCPALFTDNDSIVYFIANPTNSEYGNSLGGRELWKTDGTEEGTVRVKDFGAGNGQIQHLFAYNGEVYFGANDGTNGRELWKTDGTEEGTEIVKDIYPGSYSSDPLFITIHDDKLYFMARNGYYNSIYVTDGTSEETKQIWTGYISYYNTTISHVIYKNDLYLGNSEGFYKVSSENNTASKIGYVYNVTNFFVFNDEIYFRESGDLWKSDGTTAGTKELRNFNNTSSNGNYVAYDGLLHFQAYEYNYGTEIWSTDGTVNGTQRVTDLWPGSPGNTMPIMVYKDALLLAGSDGVTKCDVWQLHYNSAPTSSTATIITSEDIVYTFNADDFSFNDEDEEDSLTAIQIKPINVKGFLFYDKNSNQRLDHADIMIEDSMEFTLANLSQLAFVADENDFGQDYTSFTFKVKDLHQYSDSTYTAHIHVAPVADLPKLSYANVVYGQLNTEGLVVTRNEADGEEVNSVEIVEINNGQLFRHDEEKEFKEGDIISYETAHSGLKFLADSAGIGSVGVRAATSRTGDGLSDEAINYVWIDKADQEIVTDNIPSIVMMGDTITLNVSATSGLEVALEISGPAKLENNLLIIEGVGGIALVATQAGNQNYYPASPLVKHMESLSNGVITISLDLPSSAQVGDVIELIAECSVPWPVSYTVEGPAEVNGRFLTAIAEGKVIVTATQHSEDSTQTLAAVRQEIEVKEDIVASIGGPSNAMEAVSIFPNPTQRLLKIRTESPVWREAQVIIQNALGQQIAQTQLQAYQTEIDMAAYKPGMYMIILQNGTDQQVLRINKQ